MAILSPADRVSAARIRMLERAPFYGLLAMRLTLQSDPTTTDVWVDGKTLGYNPAWAGTCSFDALMSAIAHCAHHIALLHHLRRCGRNNTQWQPACDVPVNAALQAGGFALPYGARVSPGDEMKSAEEVYAAYPDQPEGIPGGGESGDGPGEVRDQPGKAGAGMDEAERNEAEADAMKDIAAAAQQATTSGLGLPASVARQIKRLLYPQQDWRELLREYMHSISKADYSWSRPNRRFIGSGLYLPSLHSESEMGEVVIAIDTSGSINEKKLTLFCCALNELFDELNPEKVTVIYCDQDIQNVTEFNRDEYPIEFDPSGFGGTDLRPPFAYVHDHHIDPDVFLYFTDLGGPSPQYEPLYPVIWMDQDGDEEYMRRRRPTFGRYVPMNS